MRGDYLALVTMAFGEILRILLNNLDMTGKAHGIISIDHPSVLGFVLTTPTHYYYLVMMLCAVEMILINRLKGSRIGRAWEAIREDEDAARAMGLNTNRLKVLACAIGAIPAGLVGVLFSGIQTFVSPVSFRTEESILLLSTVVVGGLGSIPGVTAGALLLNIIAEPLRKYTEAYRLLIFGGLLILFAQFRPQGLWPARGGVALPEEDAVGEESSVAPEQGEARG
jgi:branched-chain amino acid transport system permease protein